MGILGLLKAVGKLMLRAHISKFQGKRAGVDIMCWLHRGSYSCSREVVEGLPTFAYVKFCLKMLKLLLDNGIIPVCVFDGRALPMKLDTNQQRKTMRNDHRRLARNAYDAGDLVTANKHYQQAVSISAEMVTALQCALRDHGIAYIVSPYESDAQLAFLSTQNYVDLVITEDSDLIPYMCAHIIFKLDTRGSCVEFSGSSLFGSETTTSSSESTTFDSCPKDWLDFSGWSRDQFLLYCCLTGCDYVKKLKSVGSKMAYKIVSRHTTFQSLIPALKYQLPSSLQLDDYYFSELHKAILTFKHQIVYNPTTSTIQHLSPIPDNYSLECMLNSASRASEEERTNMFSFLGSLELQNYSHGATFTPLDDHSLEPYTNRVGDNVTVGNNTNSHVVEHNISYGHSNSWAERQSNWVPLSVESNVGLPLTAPVIQNRDIRQQYLLDSYETTVVSDRFETLSRRYKRKYASLQCNEYKHLEHNKPQDEDTAKNPVANLVIDQLIHGNKDFDSFFINQSHRMEPGVPVTAFPPYSCLEANHHNSPAAGLKNSFACQLERSGGNIPHLNADSLPYTSNLGSSGNGNKWVAPVNRESTNVSSVSTVPYNHQQTQGKKVMQMDRGIGGIYNSSTFRR